MNVINPQMTIIAYIIITIIIFLICREFICWYWKINKRIQNNEDILDSLKGVKNELRNLNSSLEHFNDVKLAKNKLKVDKQKQLEKLNDRILIECPKCQKDAEAKEIISNDKFCVNNICVADLSHIIKLMDDKNFSELEKYIKQ
tara:strand:+ start:108 stop:539 length:432 start_codon:yes stop_codon:yes gene_type:complete